MRHAHEHIKVQAEKRRKDKELVGGEDVLLKLQPYAQSSVANRPCAKLELEFCGPFLVTEHIDNVAYRLDLPPDSCIHHIFHVSQLKPFSGN